MPIKTIEVSNFKSFDEFKVELKDFNVIIGANASGKSNFTEIFRFFRDIVDDSLENAIAMQGGVEYLRNINIGNSIDFSMKIFCGSDYEYETLRKIKKKKLFVRVNETSYELILSFLKTRLDYKISKDVLKRKFELYIAEKKSEEEESLGFGELTIEKKGRKFSVNISLPELQKIKSQI